VVREAAYRPGASQEACGPGGSVPPGSEPGGVWSGRQRTGASQGSISGSATEVDHYHRLTPGATRQTHSFNLSFKLNMSIKLRELIRAVRACKTGQEERAVIAKECALIRTAFKDNALAVRHRNVAKLLFIHMLGTNILLS